MKRPCAVRRGLGPGREFLGLGITLPFAALPLCQPNFQSLSALTMGIPKSDSVVDEKNDEQTDRLLRRWRRANATLFMTVLVIVAICAAVFFLLMWG